MSLESAKMRLEQAVAQRDHVQRELEDTDRQLQAVNRKQAEVARKLFIQGGIDIYRQTQQIEDCLKIQNEKIDRASQNIKASAEAVKRSNEKLNKIDLDSLEYITNTLKELDSRTDQTYTALLDSKKRAYEEALNENRYLESHYPKISRCFWSIGQAGQGDGWFLNKIDNTIFHYNHDSGEYTKSGFTNLGIEFSQFIQLAFLYRDLEHLLDEGETLTDNVKAEFINSVNSISNNLFNVYPFKYF